MVTACWAETNCVVEDHLMGLCCCTLFSSLIVCVAVISAWKGSWMKRPWVEGRVVAAVSKAAPRPSMMHLVT